ncbi:MAG: HAMP domain-containing protein, partial [Polyangia bacterium]
MRLSLRAKLIAIVGITAFTFLVLIAAGAMIGRQTDHELATIQRRLLPKLELAPRLDADFERLRRNLQDAVAAVDAEALANTRQAKDRLQVELAAARPALNAAEVDALARAIDDYYATALDVSRRLLAGETGEALVAAMSEMQARHTRAVEALRITTTFDRSELEHAFTAAARAQATAGRVRLVVSAVCLVFVLSLSMWFSRGVLNSVRALTSGLRRFGRGEFSQPIVDLGKDELGEVAAQANQMATNLSQLAAQRDRADWLRTGHAGLSDQLRGELELEDVAARAIGYLAPYVGARVGAVYDLDQRKRLRLLGTYALSSGREGNSSETGKETNVHTGGDAPVREFALGEGLVGQAALQTNIMVVADPPPAYLRVRSGLGEA